MDKQFKNLIDEAIERLGRLGVDHVKAEYPPEARDRGITAMVTVGRGHLATQYAVLVKKGLRPATLGAVIHQLNQADKRPLLITDYVTPQLAEELKVRRVPFLDTVGNAYLDQRPYFIWVKGEKRPIAQTRKGGAGRTFQVSGLKVVFALLCNPGWIEWTYRDLAPMAGVGRGTVGWVMKELPELGFATEIRGRRRLRQPEILLRQWAEAYARTLRPKIVLGRYHTDRKDWQKNLQPRNYDMVLGGEAAAERIDGVLRAQTFTLYGNKLNPKLLMDYKLAKEPYGLIEVLEKFWNFDGFEDGIVPLPLIYADLLNHGDARCLEAAEAVYGRIIDGFI